MQITPPKKIGWRILKTTIAVMLCFMINFVTQNSNSPFYSVVAAILCLQTTPTNSWKFAKDRLVGTGIGAVFGLATLLIIVNGGVTNIWLEYIILSVMVIPIIYTNIAIKNPTSAYISTVVFFSITISHATDINPYIFAFNRMMETAVGILIALLINTINIYPGKDKNTLFIIPYQRLQITSKNKNNILIRLYRLIERKAKIVISADCLPNVFMPNLEDIGLKTPIILFDGIALYDFDSKKYTAFEKISANTNKKITEFLDKNNCNYIITEINNGTEQSFIKKLKTAEEQAYYQTLRLSPYSNFVVVDQLPTVNIFNYQLIGKPNNIKTMAKQIKDVLPNEVTTYLINTEKYSQLIICVKAPEDANIFESIMQDTKTTKKINYQKQDATMSGEKFLKRIEQRFYSPFLFK
jgi:Predicted membrane protein